MPSHRSMLRGGRVGFCISGTAKTGSPYKSGKYNVFHILGLATHNIQGFGPKPESRSKTRCEPLPVGF